MQMMAVTNFLQNWKNQEVIFYFRLKLVASQICRSKHPPSPVDWKYDPRYVTGWFSFEFIIR